MRIDISYQPSYSLGIVHLDGGEQCRVEGGSMVSMTAGVQIETQATGGVLKSLGRSLLGGESFFQNVYTAPQGGGYITVAPALPGDLFTLDLNNEAWLVQSGSYVASALGIETDTKWTGAKTFFGGEGAIMLRTYGTGLLLVSSYGAIFDMTLEAGQQYTVDTGHLVAFTEGIGFNVRSVGGMKSMLFSGEGLVVDLTGPGRVLMQTRSSQAFLGWLVPRLPFERKGGGG